MDGKPKRRWLSFSVRTMLIAVTIFCVWLAWNVSIVRERHAALQFIRDHGGEAVSFIDTKPPPGFYYPRVSAFRRWLGDTEIMFVNVKPTDHEKLSSLSSVLAEAMILVYDDFEGNPNETWRGGKRQ
jgi:hypothetical protein